MSYRCYLIVITFLYGLLTPWALFAEESAEPANVEIPEQHVGMKTQSGQIAGYLLLNVKGQEVDASYLEETLGELRGYVLLLDADGSLDSAGVVSSLRDALPRHGWSAMSVALDFPYTPELFLAGNDEVGEVESDEQKDTATADQKAEEQVQSDTESEVPEQIDNVSRIRAAIDLIKTKPAAPIILLGNGRAADDIISLLLSDSMLAEGVVLLSSSLSAELVTELPERLLIADIVPSQDKTIETLAIERKAAMKRTGNQAYVQRLIMGADTQFYGFTKIITSTVTGWLYQQFVDKGDD